MSFQVCVDANVVLKLVLSESDSDTAQALWTAWINQGAEIIAPYHLAFETTSVLRNQVYRGNISLEYAQVAFDIIREQQIRFLHPPQLVERAWALAQQFKRPTAYDCFYLALSEFAGANYGPPTVVSTAW